MTLFILCTPSQRCALPGLPTKVTEEDRSLLYSYHWQHPIRIPFRRCLCLIQRRWRVLLRLYAQKPYRQKAIINKLWTLLAGWKSTDIDVSDIYGKRNRRYFFISFGSTTGWGRCSRSQFYHRTWYQLIRGLCWSEINSHLSGTSLMILFGTQAKNGGSPGDHT